MSKQRIAIIVPVFNGSSIITEKIQEALSLQRLFPVRYYFVNDGSTDKTPLLLNKVKSSVIVLTHKKTLGEHQARDTGLRYALRDKNNSHFIFSDVDDLFYVQALKKIFAGLKQRYKQTALFTFSPHPFFTPKPPLVVRKVKVKKGVPFIYAPHVITFLITREKANWFLVRKPENPQGKNELPQNFFLPEKMVNQVLRLSADNFVSHPFLLWNHKKVQFEETPLFQKRILNTSLTGSENKTYLNDMFKSLSNLIWRTKTFIHQESVAFIVLQDMFSYLFWVIKQKNNSYFFSKERKKTFSFVRCNFNQKTVFLAWRQLGFLRQILWVALKLRLTWIIRIAFFIKGKNIDKQKKLGVQTTKDKKAIFSTKH